MRRIQILNWRCFFETKMELIERGGNPEIIPEMGRSGFWRISLFLPEKMDVYVNMKKKQRKLKLKI